MFAYNTLLLGRRLVEFDMPVLSAWNHVFSHLLKSPLTRYTPGCYLCSRSDDKLVNYLLWVTQYRRYQDH